MPNFQYNKPNINCEKIFIVTSVRIEVTVYIWTEWIDGNDKTRKH
jgi:hypothetical protein